MQFELTTDYLNKLQDAIASKNQLFIKEQLSELYAPDIAIIINQLNVEEASYLYELINDELAADVLLELDDDKREQLLSTFSSKEIAEQIDNMESDDAADVIAELPENIQEEVLAHIEDIEQASEKIGRS